MAARRVVLNMPSQADPLHTGVGRYGLSLAAALGRRGGFDYVLRSPLQADDAPDALRRSGVRIHTVPPVRSYLLSVLWQTLTRSPERTPWGKADLVVNMDPLGTAAGGRRRVTIVHDLYFKARPDLHDWKARAKQAFIYGLTLSRSDGVACISNTTGADVVAAYPGLAARVKVILSDATLEPPEGDIPAVIAPPYLLAVAHATPNKNLGVLAEAFVRVAPERPGLRLVHVGGDAAEILSGVLDRAGLGERLVRLKGVDDPTLSSLYRHALCLVVPSLYEGFCLPIVEAQRHGCPVLFSNRSAAAEVGGEGGLAFDPTDPAALARLIAQAADRPELRQSLREKGLANARRFSWDAAAEQFEALFRRVLDGAPS